MTKRVRFALRGSLSALILSAMLPGCTPPEPVSSDRMRTQFCEMIIWNWCTDTHQEAILITKFPGMEAFIYEISNQQGPVAFVVYGRPEFEPELGPILCSKNTDRAGGVNTVDGKWFVDGQWFVSFEVFEEYPGTCDGSFLLKTQLFEKSGLEISRYLDSP